MRSQHSSQILSLNFCSKCPVYEIDFGLEPQSSLKFFHVLASIEIAISRMLPRPGKRNGISRSQEGIRNTSKVSFFKFFFSWGWVRLSPLGTSATHWPIVPAPDDR
jgi:hypothetical protein